MEVEYALVTSSALPQKVRESKFFMEVDEAQWGDLVKYSEQIEPQKDSEKVMVLLVAQGTPEQEEEERRLEEQEKADQEAKEQELKLLKQKEEELNLIKQEESEESKKLRAKSKEILNALYGR